MMTKHTTEITIGDTDFTVTYNAYPAYKGRPEYPGGPPIEPDEPAEFEIVEIMCHEDIREYLTEHIAAILDAHVAENHAEEVAADEAAYADHLNDQRKEEKYFDKNR